jgi:murein DD-endopeptidase MepM/ murein hydrolase activator NlpD
MTVFYFFDHDQLLTKNIALSKELIQQQDEIESLQSINASQGEEIIDLKDKLVYSAEYFNDKLEEVNELQSQVTTLVVALNQSTHSNIDIPVSRSFDRNNEVFNPLDTTEEDNIYKDLIAEEDDDALSQYMNEQIQEFSKLVEDVENQLSYLECRPDLPPTNGQITSYFGYRVHPITKARSMHDGLDFGSDKGSPIKAAGSGIVTFSGTNGGYGKTIVVSHGYGYKTVYAHNNSNLVQVGDKVEKGQKIAEVGNTGRSTGPHLHFEVHYNGVQINPLNILDM